MRGLLAATVLGLVGWCAGSEASEPAPNELLVFVGQLISIEELPNPCANEKAPAMAPDGTVDRVCIQFNSVFEARYEILEVLEGTIDSPEITFWVADHYGFPPFADFKQALLFVSPGPEENWLEKYQGYAVHHTRDGAWASCGNPYDGRRDKEPRHLQRIDFASDFGVVGEFSQAGIARRFDMRYFDVIEERVVCRSGVYLADLYEMVRAGVMKARGYQLPSFESIRNED